MPTRVLVVDDEPAIRELLAEYLRGRGMDVEAVADGESAVGQLADAAPDVVVTDLKLPGLDGVDVARAAMRRDPPVATVVMTGFATIESVVASYAAGAHDYLVKPFRLRDVHASIERALAARQRARSAAWAEAAVRLLTRTEEAADAESAESLVAPLGALLAEHPGLERAEILAAPGPGLPLGLYRRVDVAPLLPAVRPYVHAVHRALSRVGR